MIPSRKQSENVVLTAIRELQKLKLDAHNSRPTTAIPSLEYWLERRNSNNTIVDSDPWSAKIQKWDGERMSRLKKIQQLQRPSSDLGAQRKEEVKKDIRIIAKRVMGQESHLTTPLFR
jgi:mannitol-1-phosphate/altronate dehydrogenase